MPAPQYPQQYPQVTVERVENTLVVMDEDGSVLDTHEIRPQRGGGREAKQVIRRWAARYTFAWAEAMRLV